MNVKKIASMISKAKSLLLTTHKQCDGDGLGAGLGLYHALKKTNKKVRMLCVDEVPKKYDFLDHKIHLELFNKPHSPLQPIDLALIFDTNDRRLVEPLYSEMEKKCKKILFIDHHPILNQGPEPTAGSFVDTKAASTGEIAFFIIKMLKIPIDANIARAIYTSIVFDTQLFRYVRNSPHSHTICAELLLFEKKPEEVHNHLLSTFSRGKVTLLAKIFKEIEYHANGQIAVSLLRSKDLTDNNLDMDDARDIIDMIMNIKSVLIAALFREDHPQNYKLSLRSRKGIEVLRTAENFQGGGHTHASGATLKGDYQKLKKDILKKLIKELEHSAVTSIQA